MARWHPHRQPWPSCVRRWHTDPEVAWGLTEDEAKAKGIAVKKGLFPWSPSGRAIANGRDDGFTKLLFDVATPQILGGNIVGTHADDMITEVAHGSCTDLPAARS